jgi:hypothetical protein
MCVLYACSVELKLILISVCVLLIITLVQHCLVFPLCLCDLSIEKSVTFD